MSAGVEHDYHLVDPSPWPALGALGAFALTFGTILYMHEDMLGGIGELFGIATIFPGLLLIAATMVFWWRDVIREATYDGHHTPVVQLGHRYGMFLFIASEVMFFAAFFWAFFDSSLFPRVDPAVWPPQGIEPFDPWELPLINTFILVTSSGWVTLAHLAVERGDRKWTIIWLLMTILFGAAFTGLQGYEYVHASFGFKDGIYSSTFYMATGFHGFHVIIGTTFLTVCLFRAIKGHFKPAHHFGFEAAAWYWHFVDVVWIFLFSCVYIWGG